MYPIPCTLQASSYSVLRQHASGQAHRGTCTGGTALSWHAAAVPVPHHCSWAGLCARGPPRYRFPFGFRFLSTPYLVGPSLSSLQVKFPSVLSVPAKHRTTILQARLLPLQRPPIGCPIGCREQWQDPVAAIVAFSSISQSLCRLGTLLVAPSTFLAGGSHGGAPYRNRLSAVTPVSRYMFKLTSITHKK